MAIGEQNAAGHLEWSPMMTGARMYGPGGSHTATSGPVDKSGYRDRGIRNAQRNALLARLAAMNASGTLSLGSIAPGGGLR